MVELILLSRINLPRLNHFQSDYPGIDRGTKTFILTLEEGKTWRGNIYKSYDMLALNNFHWYKLLLTHWLGKNDTTFLRRL
jgi:hypothetical protein